ncbi:response regulator [Methylomonas sp. LL1]|uniref:ATP-binding protein n=1 Tax=Methylomonas sp. LL1 TaxID=2785785 RepID=UPI0018C430C9|nr:ATP-binding protein [Methylomonas sp. LL1]QPK65046.1 response regulator [Methylomonas sp. LL1]
MPSIKSLAGRLFKLVFGWYLLLAILVTCFQLGFEFLLIRSTIGADMAALGQSFTPAVADAIWTFDQPLLDSLINGMGQASIITGAKIENSRGDILAKVGRLPDANEAKSDDFLAPFQMHELSLWSKPLTESHVSRELGKMVLYSDRNVVLVRIKYSFMVILINSLVKTAGLWLIFYWAITWRLSKPLTKLSQTVSTLNFRADEIEPVPIEYREQDEVGQLVASLNDMRLRLYTAHRELEQKVVDLAQARDVAEAANRAKSIFLANMSHELRTPLNAILGFSSMMRKDTQLPESPRKNLDIINRSGEHLLALINDILEKAKIDAGRLQPRETPFDLDDMLRDVVDTMHLQVQEKGLQLLIDPSSSFPRFIIGDRDCLRQVLINLIGNAIKFTQQGSILVRLGTRRDESPRLWIEIEDTGPGIAPEDQQRIFEPFVQLGEHSLNKGTGLGLSIARQYLEMMGGGIELESNPGKGARFRIDLPLKEASEITVIPQPVQAGQDVVGLAPGQPEYRILIIEDQSENQLLLSKLMETLGLRIKIAVNGEQGVQLFQSWQPHLIWMNHRPPVIDGCDTARAIRRLPGGKAIKIVAITPSDFMAHRDELLNTGMDDVVSKPYRAHEIHGCLSKQLGLRFIYEIAPEQQALSTKLSPEMLLVVPKELRQQLQHALESLDTELIDRMVEQIGPYDQNLKAVLVKLTDNFDFPAILKVLRNN